jgi:hypothetical protein
MKLPFNFGIKLIFRMIFPGAILAAALVPAVHGILHAMGFSIKFEYLFPVEVILWGWIINVSDMQIYMLFEGRRYWPSPIRKLRIWCQQRRLKRLSQIFAAERMGVSVDRRRSLEPGVEYGLYPTDEHGEACVAQPTRLGNIIESYETYSNVKYGLDSVFYWYRLWVMLDKDLREEIDSSQAMVDSTVYVSFVLYASAFVMLAYAGIGATAHLHWSYINWLSAIKLPFVPAPGVLCGMAVACLVIGFIVYRLSLPAHAKFGELFKSVFDQYRSKLVFDDVLKTIAHIKGVPSLTLKSQWEKNRIVWRYLRWHLIRDDATHRNLTIKEWEDSRHPPSSAAGP